jgi:hypothetical protein
MRVFWEKGYDGTSLPDRTRPWASTDPACTPCSGTKKPFFKKPSSVIHNGAHNCFPNVSRWSRPPAGARFGVKDGHLRAGYGPVTRVRNRSGKCPGDFLSGKSPEENEKSNQTDHEQFSAHNPLAGTFGFAIHVRRSPPEQTVERKQRPSGPGCTSRRAIARQQTAETQNPPTRKKTACFRPPPKFTSNRTSIFA